MHNAVKDSEVVRSLSILATEHALLEREQLRLDIRIKQMLETTKQLLSGEINQAAARLVETRAEEDGHGLHEESFITFVYEAALVTLSTSLGYPCFGGQLITDKTIDGELDPWSSDAAKWASFAVAERPWVPAADNQKRLEFWLWWLDEAIPAAIAT